MSKCWSKTQGWIEKEIEQIEVTEKELADNARCRRNMLLSETDYPSDHPKFTEDMKRYRQLLRDLPRQEGFPYNIIWPSKPE